MSAIYSQMGQKIYVTIENGKANMRNIKKSQSAE